MDKLRPSVRTVTLTVPCIFEGPRITAQQVAHDLYAFCHTVDHDDWRVMDVKVADDDDISSRGGS